jgi:hypothetical protein
MDVSNRDKLSGGPALIDQVVTATGLPDDLVTQELDQILGNAGCSKENVTLEQLREAMLTYLESLHQEVVEAESSSSSIQSGE